MQTKWREEQGLCQKMKANTSLYVAKNILNEEFIIWLLVSLSLSMFCFVRKRFRFTGLFLKGCDLVRFFLNLLV